MVGSIEVGPNDHRAIKDQGSSENIHSIVGGSNSWRPPAEPINQEGLSSERWGTRHDREEGISIPCRGVDASGDHLIHSALLRKMRGEEKAMPPLASFEDHDALFEEIVARYKGRVGQPEAPHPEGRFSG